MGELILDGHKLLWHKERVAAWLRGERIAPITIDCALTRSCTYRCVYCYGQLQANDEKKMSREVIFRFLDDAAEIGVTGILIWLQFMALAYKPFIGTKCVLIKSIEERRIFWACGFGGKRIIPDTF